MSEERDMCDQRRQEIYAKQGRGSTRFASVDERDQWIRKELKILVKAREDKRALAERLRRELDDEQRQCDKYRSEVAAIVKRTDEQHSSMDSAEREHFELVRRKDELQTRRNELWRAETQLAQECAELRDEQQKIEYSLRSATGRTLLQVTGHSSINSGICRENIPKNLGEKAYFIASK